MRGDYHVVQPPPSAVGRQRLELEGVNGGARYAARTQRVVERVLIHYAAARYDYQVRGRLHQRQFARSYHALRVLRVRRGHHEPVGHLQQVVQPVRSPDFADERRRREWLGVNGADIHPEGVGAPGDRRPYAAERENPHRRALYLDDGAVILGGVPYSRFLVGHHVVRLVREGEADRHHVVGHRRGVRPPRVRENDVAVSDFGYRCQLVYPGAWAVQPAQAVGGEEHVPAGRPHERVRVFYLSRLLVFRRREDELHVGEVLGKPLLEPVAKQRCNDYFHSGFLRFAVGDLRYVRLSAIIQPARAERPMRKRGDDDGYSVSEKPDSEPKRLPGMQAGYTSLRPSDANSVRREIPRRLLQEKAGAKKRRRARYPASYPG